MMISLWIIVSCAVICTGLSGAVHVDISGDLSLAAPGDDVSFSCRVTDGIVGIIVYINKDVTDADGNKRQELIATNDILTPLYEGLGRFEASYVDVGDATLFILDITGVTTDDTGFYGCYLAREGVYDTTRFEVYKQAESIEFVGHSAIDPYVFTEGEPLAVECFVDDVIPIPDVRIHIEDNDYTDGFVKSANTDLHCDDAMGSSKDCPLTFNYDITLKHVGLIVDYSLHGKMITCESNMQVPLQGLEPISVFAPVVVNYSPKFMCDSEFKAALYEPFNMSCEVLAQPLPLDMAWYGEVAGEQVWLHPGDTYLQFTAVKERTSGTSMMYTLVIAEVWPTHLTAFSLHVQHPVSNNTHTITLSEHIVTTEPIGAATSVHVMYSVTLLSCLLATLQL